MLKDIVDGRGSSDRLKFSYTFVDTRLPSMQLPVPCFACILRPSVSKTFFVLLFADLSKPANYTHPTPIVTYALTKGAARPWTSETSVRCLVGHGARGTRRVVMMA